jgi:hypothetical protein
MSYLLLFNKMTRVRSLKLETLISLGSCWGSVGGLAWASVSDSGALRSVTVLGEGGAVEAGGSASKVAPWHCGGWKPQILALGPFCRVAWVSTNTWPASPTAQRGCDDWLKVGRKGRKITTITPVSPFGMWCLVSGPSDLPRSVVSNEGIPGPGRRLWGQCWKGG